MTTPPADLRHRLVVLYGVGGLSDVGRHAVQAALELDDTVEHVTVLTQQPELLLEESNWKCGCVEPHVFSEADRKRLTVVRVQDWKNEDLTAHLVDATAVVSCLGNRQGLTFHWIATEGNQALFRALQQLRQQSNDNKPKRVVVISSVGLGEDWPAMEFVPIAKYIFAAMIATGYWTWYRDLVQMERLYESDENIDYLLVRPVGISEDVVPVGRWYLQKEKHVDDPGLNMAKLDVARYMVQEALHPTRHREAVVIGPGPPDKNNNEQEKAGATATTKE